MRHISPRGRAVLVACFVVGGGLLTGAPSGSEGAGWASAAVAALAGMAAAWAVARLGCSAPGSGLAEALDLRFGRTASAAVKVVLSAMTAGLLLRDAAVITKFVGANMMPGTPEMFIALSFALTAAWCAAAGRSVVGRWAELVALPMFLLLAFAFALAARDFGADAVEDGLREGAGGILPGAVGIFAESFGSVLVCSAVVFPFSSDEKHPALPLVVGAALGGAVLAVVMLMNVALLGSSTIELFNFPTYHALRVSGVDGVLERMEALLMLPAVMFVFLRVAAELTLFAELAKSSAAKKLTPFVMAAVAAAASLAVFPSQIELREHTEAALGIYAALWALIAVLFAAVGRRRRR